MHLPGTLCFFVTLFSLTQVKEASASCDITSITSPSASSLLVKWSYYQGATNYVMDVKAVNSDNTSPVSVPALASSTVEKLVQGLKPGQIYQVTFKVVVLNIVTCISSQIAQTVPATSQITDSRAISSTSIRFVWSSAQGADKYFLMVNGTFHIETRNLTFTTLNGQVDNLRNNTPYSCYVYSSNAAGLGARSLVKTIRTLVQPPDGLSVIELTQSTARASWLSVPGVLLYQLSVTANNKLALPLRNVTSTAVNISSLQPCLTYTIGIASINMFLEPGEPANFTYTTSTITTVSSISVEYSCVTAMASVRWDAVFGAMSYRAVITDGQGRSLNCTSTDTTCQIPMLKCGERYSVRITAIANCESTSDGSYVFETAPCPPKAPHLYRECSSNVILFLWSPTNSTAYYHAQAVDSDGLVTDCITMDTSCYFTNTICGKGYSFYVKSIYSGGLDCNSGYTEGVMIKTAPCLPQNIYTTANCNSIGSAVTSWDMAEGAYTYTVEARGNRREFYNCTSPNTSCTLTGLDCGESLSVWIIATDGNCTTDPVMGEVAETVPCIPQNVSAVGNCSSDSVSLSWLTSNGAIFYIGMATGADGIVHTCTAMATECTFQNLTCGKTYDAFVIATNMQCNSSGSQHVTLQTAPCAPVSVAVAKDCAANRATVSWQTFQAGGLYTAVLQCEHGATVNCSTSFNNCTTADLLCGMNYNVTVTTNDGHCRSLPSTPIQIQTVPCDPQNVTTVLQCNTNAANVTWAASAGANGYTAMATDGQLQRLASCHTMGTSCQLTSLPCGMRLNVTVQADGASCNSSSQPKATVLTAPCIPTHVTAALNCSSNIASITWYSALGATWYLVKAEGSQGYKTSCNNTVTRCDIPNLQCGQEYSITVMGMNGDCMGPVSQSITLVSAPCPNTGIQARLDCRTNSALVSWTPGNGALNFNATLQSLQDAQKRSCFTSGSSCNISSLQCGTRYNVSVTGYGQNCSTCSKPLVTLDTAPCVPTQVNVSLSCGSDTASVSWAASSGLVSYYIVTAEGDNGITLTCNSSSTSCNISRLACGQAYNVSVTAMSVDCTGQRSEVRRVNTAPCVPQNVSANVSCSSNIATVTWGNSQGAELYTVTASSVNGLSANCTSASTSCDLSTLTCGESYTITVKATGSYCCSGNSAPVQVQTAPCPPLNIQSRMNCGNNTASVSWSRGNGALSFLTTLECSNGQTYMCRTNETGCDITNMTCGQTCLVKVLAEGRSCNSSVGTGSPIITAPCPNTGIQARLDCRTNSALVSWTPGNGALNFNATLQSLQDAQKRSCFTSGSSCNISSLQCGTRYNVSVTGYGQNCSTCSKPLVTLDTAPCVPTQVNVSLFCGTDTASVSWAASSGLVSYYIVTAEGDNGITLTCNSSSTSCNISRLACGQAYNVSVTAMSVDCTGQRSEVRRVNTAPCVPQNVSANVSCSSNIATVTWGSSQGAELYTVTASSVNGLSANCTSASTSCDLSTLTCGESYTITVKATGSYCCSGNSAPVQVQTAPCPPLNIQSRMNCGNNTASVSWSRGNGALSFLTTLECSNGQTYMCRTNETGCDITNMTCGQTCLVKVLAEGRSCNSSVGTGSPIITAPCPNTGIQARLDCRTNSALVSWTPGNGALNFNATLQSLQDAQKRSCFTSGSSCNISSLQCGTRYNVSVTGYGQNCSTCSKPLVTLDTAPCVPTQVNVSLSCGSDTASVSWAASSGLVSYYIVTAEGDNGITLTCNSSSTSCNISRLACGQAYNVSVTAMSVDCTGQRSEVRRVNTAPCVPQNVSANVSCSSNIATVTWGSSQGAELYTVTASSVNGLSANCTSASTSCDLSTLTCGESYTVTVKATGSYCCSGNSAPVQVQTAPCPPLNIQSRMNCGNNTASVSWSRGNGALSFLTTLECSNGQTYMCRTNETGCDITNMTCGQTCLVKVLAEGRSCNSSVGTGSPIITAPCPNTGIQARLDCRTNSALVSWTPGNGALNFNATLQSLQDAQKRSCFTSGSSCNISSLQCGTRYNVSVTGYGQNCSTCSKPLVTLDTAPCVPTQVNVSLSCGSDTASVSWAASSGLVSYYIVTAEGDNGITLTCNSSSTSCNISRLACGQAYNVSVTAMSVDCTGQRSEVRRVNTAPCVPQNVSANVSCSSNIATVTWGSSQGAELYTVTASSVNGLSANCTSASTSCDLSTLTCGESYTITVKATGSYCCSGNSAPVQVQTAPCPPLNIQSRMNCGNNTASVSWSRGNGALSFLTTLECSNGQTYMCRTNETGCDITNMTCGQTCLVKVLAEGRSCNSSVGTGSPIITAPCPNTGIQARLDCRTNSALVSWTPGNGALNFNATLQSLQDAQKRSCFTSGSSCNISSLQCGTRYNVSVTGYGQNCSTCSKPLVTLDTAPCVPTQVNVSSSCGSDTASVSWAASSGLVSYYIVTAEGDNGITLTCNSSSTSCNISRLACGQAYNVSVTAMSVDCTGQRSKVRRVNTAPCVPQNVSANVSCSSNIATVTWGSSQGAELYTVTASSVNGLSANCTSASTSCDLSTLTCGESYTITVKATGSYCCSGNSAPLQVQTAPCPNTGIQARLDCRTNSALVSWTPGNGALNFNATLQSLQDAQKRSCFTSGSSCNISSLQCGTRYNVSVTGYGQNCSTCSKPLVTLDTAPCVPTQVNVSLSCGSDTASVSWAASSGLVSYYIVTAEGDNGITLTCNSSSTSCNISRLACGQAYNVSVTAMSVDCTGQRSEVRRVNTAPCVPQNVSANVSCSSNIATVTWGSSQGAELYTVTASSVNGLSANCTSASTSCDLSTLTCGESYTITVKATGSYCCSGNSAPVQVQTASCPPLNIQSRMNCGNNTASVSWSRGNGALSFLTTLECSNGQTYMCRTNETGCDITNMTCGQTCLVKVLAEGRSCNSSVGTGSPIITAPCPNTGIQARLDCRTNSALVSWTPGSGALNFNATLQSLQDAQKRSCFTSGSSCNISSLQCGTHYNVSVTGYGQNCSTCSKPLVTLDTAPCVPTQVNVSLSCGSDTASVSWAASSGLVSYYIVTAEGDNGITLTCNSSSTSCNISRLACGQAYNVSVTAMSVDCTGQRSEVRRVNTAPCVPQNVSANVSCSSNIATVTWGSSQGAELYTVTASSVNGLSANCTSASTSCDLSTLTCGESYTITVKATGSYCCSGNSAPVQVQTAPCPPLNIQSRMNCGNNTASVSWSRGNGALSFLTTLECSNGQTYMCRTNETGCDITNMTCGQTCLVKVLAEGRSCNSSVGTGSPIITAPCPNTGIQARLDCRTNSALVSWTPGNGALNFNATLQSLQDAQKRSCFTSGSSCNISSLQCGTRYNVSVTGYGQNCSTCSKPLVTLDTAPCVPTQVNVSLSCGSDTASVSWAASSGLVSYYIVTAEGDNGITLTCNSSSTSCNISRLACGQAYNVSVTAMSVDCTGQRSEVRRVNTAPCVPQNVSANVSCSSNIATVTWGSSQGAELYTVTASSVNGLSANCTSASTSCDLSTLTCGESYTITVKATGSYCCSGNSAPVQVQTAPCPPLNIQSRMNCGNNTASVSWSCGNGALSFLTTLECSNGQTYMCRTNETGCDITNMTCGQTCLVKVLAEGRSCNSSVGTGSPIITAPCPNTGIQARLDCRTNSALVSWTPGSGALNFNATLQSLQDAQKRSCFTSGSSCNISSLQCGTRYNVSVTGYGQNCSTCSKPLVTLDTAPCVPTQVNVSLSCGSDTASVSWAASSGLVSYYIVTAEGDNGITLTCNSSSTSCNISRLACGQAYNVSVTAMSVDCTGQRSEVRRVNTALHSPQGVNGTVDCVTNSAWVSWDVVKGAESYTVLAVGDDGQNTTCSSPNNTCNVPDLGCGKNYTIQVTASNAACLSPPSNSFQLETAPCALASIVVVAECQSSVIMVQWQRARKANSLYIVTAEDQDRVHISCNSSASSCNLTSVQCGKEYTIIVAASANQCSSLRSPPYKIRTAPCRPSQVQAVTDCQSKAVFVSWEPSYVAQSYLLTAVSRDGDLKTCNTSYNNCTLTDLHCSNTYNVSVLASNENCTSLPSTNVNFKTVPCEPVNVTANVQCNSTASLSWVRSTGAVAYVGIAQSKNATTVYCQNTEASCTLVGLVCGTVYNFTVQATDGICNSSMSTPQIGGAAPCPPAGLRVVPLSCTVANETQILRASWSTVSCPNSEYLFGLKGSIQGNSQAVFDLASYWTSHTFFELPLPCGSSYSATIRARNFAASSAESAAVNGTTVPCAPINVTFSASSAVVAWHESIFATNYTVYGVTSSGRTKLCMTSQFQCSIASFNSGRIVVTARSAAGESEDSVPILVTARRRR